MELLEARLAPATYIWDGGAGADSRFSNKLNWSGNVAPTGSAVTMDDLVFPTGAATFTPSNDIVGAVFNSITISASNYHLTGTPMTLGSTSVSGGGFIIDQAGDTGDVIAVNITLASASGSRQFFTVNPNANLTISGKLSGSTGSELTKDGTGTLVLAGDNSGYTGPVDIQAGVLQITNANALGKPTTATTTFGTTTVEDNAQLQVNNAANTITAPINEPLLLNGPGITNTGAILNVAGSSTWNANVQLDSDTTMGSTTGTLTITGQISDLGAGHNLTKEGLGEIFLNPQFANGNTYRGTTTVNGGLLAIGHPFALGPGGQTTTVNSTTAESGTVGVDWTNTSNPFIPAQYLIQSAGAPAGFNVPNVPLVLNGQGQEGIHVSARTGTGPVPTFDVSGALDNLAGDNAWEQGVALWSNSGSVLGDINVWPLPVVGIGAEAGSILTINGAISDNAAGTAYDLVKTRPGQIILPRANTFGGAGTLIDILDGTLTIEDSQALGPAKNGATVFNGATLALQAAATWAPAGITVPHVDSLTGTPNLNVTGVNLTLIGTGSNVTGALRNIDGTNQWTTGTVSITSLVVRAPQSFPSTGAAIGVDADAGPFNAQGQALSPVGLSQLTVNGLITGPSGMLTSPSPGIVTTGAPTLTKVGYGELVLTAANTYVANTFINQGWITVENNFALGGTIPGIGDTQQPMVTVAGGAALVLKQTPTGTNININRNVHLGTGLGLTMAEGATAARFPWLNQKGALENLDGNNTFGGDIFLNGAASIGVELDGNDALPLLAGATPVPTPPSQLTLSANVNGGDGWILNEPGASGPGGFDKLGSQRLIDQDNASFTGPVDVQSGVLQVANGLGLGAGGSTTTVEYGAALEFGTTNPLDSGGVAAGFQVWGEHLILNGPGDLGSGVVQTVTVTGGVGTFTLAFDGQATGPLPYNATAAQVQTALNALKTISGPGGSVTVTQSSNVYTVTFGGSLAATDPALLAGTGSGGAGVTVTGSVPNSFGEVQTVAVSGSGTFTLSYNGQTTAALATNATAAQVQSALNGLSTIGGAGGSVTVTQLAGVYTITFGGSLVNADPASLSGTGSAGVSVSVAASIPALSALASDMLWRGAVTLSGSTNLITDANARLTFNGTIDDAANLSVAGSDLTKLGPGELVLSGTNTYRGNTFINQGTVTVSNGEAFGVGSSGQVVVANGANLQIEGNITIAGKQLVVQGTGTIPSAIPVQWFPLGPAPITNGQTPGNSNTPTSGQVTGVAADPTDPSVIYVAAGGGGIWKTVNGGNTWIPLTDSTTNTIDEYSGLPISVNDMFMGSLAISPSNPHVLYAGTGSMDNSVDTYYGRGVLMSSNSGETWTLMYPESGTTNAFDRKAITAVQADPQNPFTFYVSVANAGNANGLTGNNGVWEFNSSTKTWTNLTAGKSPAAATKITFNAAEDDYTGVVVMQDLQSAGFANRFLAMAIGNPDGGWANFFKDGGALGTGQFRNGVYISLDNGATWNLDAGAAPINSLTELVTDPFLPGAPGITVPVAGMIKIAAGTGQGEPADNALSLSSASQFNIYAAASYPNVYPDYPDPFTPTGLFTGNASGATTPVQADHFRAIWSTSIVWKPGWAISTWGGPGSPSDYQAASPNFIGQGSYDSVIAVDPQNSNNIFVGGIGQPSSSGPFISTNAGKNWTDIGLGANGNSPHNDYQSVSWDSADRLLVGTDGGIWRLDNANAGAVVWTDLNGASPFVGNLDITKLSDIAVDPNNPNGIIAAGQSTGTIVFNGTTWTQVAGGNGSDVAMNPNSTNIVYDVQDNPLPGQSQGYAADDPAYDPTAPYTVHGNNVANSFTLINNTATPFQSSGVYESTSGGAVGTWSNIRNVGSLYFPLVLDPLNSQRLLIGSAHAPESPGYQLQESLDGGASWHNLGLHLPIIGVSSIAVGAYQGPFQFDSNFPLVTDQGANTYDPNTIYVAQGSTATSNDTNYGHVAVTKDHGNSWVDITDPAWAPYLPIANIYTDPRSRDTLYVVMGSISGAAGVGKVFVTHDAGHTWGDVSAGLPDLIVHAFTIDPRNGDLYVGNDSGVWKLSGGAGSWVPFGASMPDTAVTDLVLNPNTNILTAATYGRGVFQIYLDSQPAVSAAVRQVAGSAVWTGPVQLAGATTISSDGVQNVPGFSVTQLNIVGTISDAPGTSNNTLIKIGPGDLILSGANTYSGLTDVQAGNLVVHNPNALSGSQTTVETGAALELESDLFNEPLLLNGNGLTFNGHNTGALRNSSNDNSYNGVITLNTNATIGVDSGSQLTIGGSTYTLTFPANGPQPTLIANGTGLIGTNPSINVVTSQPGTAGTPAVQLISFGGHVLGGTFTLSFNGATTAPIAYSPIAATLEANIENALALLPPLVTFDPVNQDEKISFQYPGIQQTMIADGSGLTTSSGTAAAVVVTTRPGNAVTSAIQTLTFSGAITGGTFTLSFNGVTTAAIPWNVDGNVLANNIELALQQLLGAAVGSSLVLTQSAGITSGTHTFALTKEGTGELVLATNDSYTSGSSIVPSTIVNQGILNIQSPNALGAPGSNNLTQVLDGAQLQMQGNFIVKGQTLQMSGTGIFGTGALETVDDVTGPSANTWQGPVTLAQDAGFSPPTSPPTSIGIGVLNAADTLTIDGQVNQVTGTPLGIIKVGGGMLVLTNSMSPATNNTYNGLTEIFNGILRIQIGGALGSTQGGTLVDNGTALQIDGDPNGLGGAGITVAGEALTLNGTGISGGGAVENISGQNTWTGSVTLPNTTGAANIISIGADLETVGAAQVQTQLTISGAVQDASPTPTPPSDLHKVGQGIVVFPNANSYAGLTSIDAGDLRIGNAGSLGAAGNGTVVQNGASLQVQGGITVSSEPLTLNGNGYNNAGALENFTGNNTWAQSILLATSSAIGVDVATDTLVINQPVGDQGNGLAVTKVGPGTLDYKAANTYTGLTQVNQGTLLLDDASGQSLSGNLTIGGASNPAIARWVHSTQVPASDTVTVNSQGLLDLNGQTDAFATLTVQDGQVTTGPGGTLTPGTLNMTGGSFTVATGGTLVIGGGVNATSDNLTGAAVITGPGTVSLNGATRTFNVNAGTAPVDLDIQSVVAPLPAGTEGLTKSGTGTLELDAVNTYAGPTTINQGDVRVDGTIGNVLLNGGEVSGLGTVGTISAAPGNTTTVGTIDPGDDSAAGATTGKLTSQTVTLGSGSVFSVDLNGADIVTPGQPGTAHDLLAVNGNANLNGATLTGVIGPNVKIGDTFTILTTTGGTVNGTFADPFGSDPNNGLPVVFFGTAKFDIVYNATNVEITRVKSNVGVTVSSSANPVTYGQDVTFLATATPEPGSGVLPFGEAVTFTLNGATLSNPIVETVPLNATSQAVFDPQTYASLTLSPGVYTLGVTYDGDANFNSATTTLSPDETINQDSTNIAISAAPTANPVFGQQVTITATITPVATPVTSGALLPTGTIQFLLGSGSSGTPVDFGPAMPINAAGQASIALPANLPSGLNLIDAVYSGDTNYLGVENASHFQVNVLKDSSSTAVTASTPTTSLGQTVTFTANITAAAPGAGAPTGSVTFFDGAFPGGTSLGTETLGVATVTFQTNGVQPTMSANGSLLNGSAPSVSVATTTPGTATNPAIQTITFGGAVGGGSFTLTFGSNISGPIAWSADAPTLAANIQTALNAIIGANAATASVTASEAVLPVSSLTVGTHTISVAYSGDSNFVASSGALDNNTSNYTVTKGSSSTVVSSSGTTVFGQTVTLSATVAAVAPAPGTPTGKVQFIINGIGQPSVTLNASGVATFATSSLNAGTYTITASYAGDGNFLPSDNTANPFMQTVNKAATQTAVTGPSSSVYGQPDTFTANVTAVPPGAGTPTGTVTFAVDGVPQGSGVVLVGGQATFVDSALSVSGTAHNITATYAGDNNFTGSNDNLTPESVIVGMSGSKTTITTSGPAVFGQPATLTASVVAVAPGAGIPSGTVTFTIDGTPQLTTPSLNSSGQATFVISTLSVAIHTVSVRYGGDGNFFGSSSPTINETVVQDKSTVTVSSSGASVFGQKVTFTATIAAAAPGAGTPTGTVTFNIDGANEPGAALSGGIATFADSALSVGTHRINASYGGDTDFLSASTTSSFSQVVSKDGSNTTVTTSGATVYGQPLTFTATVQAAVPGAGTPTGLVTFAVDGANQTPTATLSGGIATYVDTALTAGPHNISATYAGDGNFTTSTSLPIGQTVGQASSATSVSTSSPTFFGQPVTFTATVVAHAPGAGTPTGSVTFVVDGGNLAPTSNLSGGIATYVDSSLSVGSHSLSAVYNGDTNFLTSTATAINQTITQAGSKTTVTSSAASAVYGQTLTFTASVTAVSPGTGVPTGSVTFVVDGANQLPTPTLSGGVATFTDNALPVGSHNITAIYGGDTNFLTSNDTTSPFVQKVTVASTSTSVSSSGPSVFGQRVTFTATITPVAPGAGAPTGTVTFVIDGANQPAATLAGGQATFVTTTLSVGTHQVSATYSGDGNFAGSNSSLSIFTQAVGQAGTATNVTPSSNPSGANQPVTFTATVLPVSPGSGTPTGTVSFVIDGTTQSPAAGLVGGQATFVTSSLNMGSHTVSATYNGDTNFTPSTSSTLTQTVLNASATKVTASVNPSVFGQPITLTASVSAVAPATGTPTGTVSFFIDSVNQGQVTLSAAGTATFAVGSLPAGTHSVSAGYSGDTNFSSSSPAIPLGLTINRANTSTTVSAAPTPSTFGQTVVFSAIVAPVSPGAGTPTGTVTFTIDGTAQSPVTLVGGQATLGDSTLGAGTHSISAVYNDDSNFAGSSSTTYTQKVTQAGTSTALTPSGAIAFGQTVTFTAAVTNTSTGTATPAGTVTFVVDGVNQAPLGLNGSGQATLALSTLSGGSHTITADYNGNANFASSSASTSFTVSQALTHAAVTASVNPSAFGQTVTFTGTITNTSSSATPTGSVQFVVDGTNQGAPVTLNSTGSANLILNSLAVGPHTIAVTYAGNGNFAASDNTGAPLSQTVTQAATATTLASSPNPATPGQTIAFTATVVTTGAGSTTPTGQVTFNITGPTNLTVPATLTSAGKATFTTNSLPVGIYSVTADYSGSANFAASSSTALTQKIAAASRTRLASSKNPATVGQTVTVTASVTTGATGTITFFVDGVDKGSFTLDGTSKARITLKLGLGKHSIKAIYSGDASFNGSSASFVQTMFRTAGRRL
jgi:autotransporter-associated beta strand protein